MGQPVSPITLTEEQVRELNHKLGLMRHEVNNQLSLIVAALEMIRFRPESRDRMMETLAQQPLKIQEELARFSEEFEQTLGFSRD
jgi:hypothetical protein